MSEPDSAESALDAGKRSPSPSANATSSSKSCWEYSGRESNISATPQPPKHAQAELPSYGCQLLQVIEIIDSTAFKAMSGCTRTGMTKSYRIDPEHNTTRHVIQLSKICKGMEHVKKLPPKSCSNISSLADYRSTDSLPPPAECTCSTPGPTYHASRVGEEGKRLSDCAADRETSGHSFLSRELPTNMRKDQTCSSASARAC